jgi:hypothetical protein
MPGYANRTVRLDFEDLSEDGELIHVILKNPKIVPLDELQPADVPLGPDGQPVEEEARIAMYRVVAGLVKAWHVYDATSTDDDQPRLGLPATPDAWDINKEIFRRIREVTNPS